MHTGGLMTPEVGDEFAVFRPGINECVGVLTWTGAADSLTIWGYDALNPGLGGMRPGEVMEWRIWDASANDEYRSRQHTPWTQPATARMKPRRSMLLGQAAPTAVSLATFAVFTPASLPTLYLALLATMSMMLLFAIAQHRLRGMMSRSFCKQAMPLSGNAANLQKKSGIALRGRKVRS